MTKSIYEQIEATQQAAKRLVAAIVKDDASTEEILAAEWSEASHPRDKGGRFNGGDRPALSDGSAKPANKKGGMGRNVKGAAVGVAIGIGARVAYENRDSIQSGLTDLGNKASAAKIAGVATAIDSVEGMNAKVKGAMAGLNKKLGLDSSEDTPKSGGEHLMASVSKMGTTLKSGSTKALQLTAARAATAVAAAQNETARNVFIDQLKRSKNGADIVNTIHKAATAIDTVAHVAVTAIHLKSSLNKAKQSAKEHAVEIEKGTAAAVGIGVAVMASKKFAGKGKGIVKPPSQEVKSPGKGATSSFPGKNPRTLPPAKQRLALPPGVDPKPPLPRKSKVSPAIKAGIATVGAFGALAVYENNRLGSSSP